MRLEKAEFYIRGQTLLTNGSETEQHVYTHIASIPLSLGQFISSSPEQRVGATLQSMQRYIQLAGIVMDWGWSHDRYDATGGLTSDGMVTATIQLMTDRINIDGTGAPVPSSLGFYSPYNTNFPTAVLSSSTPGVTSESERFPTRVHWTRTEMLYSSPTQLVGDTSEILYVPQGQKIDTGHRTINRRIRIRLDDIHAFFVGWHFITNPGYNQPDSGARTINRWARGTLFYRFHQ